MLRVFKTSSNALEIIEIDKFAIRQNHNNGRKTTIMFDTNVLITIEAAYRSGTRHQKLKETGVFGMSELIRKCAKYGVFIAPAAAYQELPPSRRRDVEAAFKRFLKDYLPTFREDPNSTKVSLGDGGAEPEPFKLLPRERQEFISCSYASLLAMNAIDLIEELNEIEKFILYFDYCAELLDLVSLKELTIARYVFSPDIGITEELRRRKVAATKNFLRLKKGGSKGLTPSEVLKRIALNGANDLRLISAADIVSNSLEQFGIGVVKHDVWIATSDDKLYEFCCACPGFIGEERGGTLARFVDTHENIAGTRYWRDSMEIQTRRLEERYLTISREKEMGPVVDAALKIEVNLDSGNATEYFRLRSWR